MEIIQPIEKRRQINSLKIIRAVSFLLVCLHHSKLKIFVSSGYYGSSVFLILSGFLMAYNYADKKIENSFKFATKKIGKLYALYALCALAMLPFMLVGDAKEPMIKILLTVFTNFSLIHEWLPLNVVDIGNWFVSALFFSYLVFPIFNARINKKYSRSLVLVCMAFLFCFQIFVSYIDPKLTNVVTNSVIFREDWSFWFVYFCALTRISDFLIGCCLGYLFINKEFEINKESTILEIILVIMQIIPLYICNTYKDLWCRYTVIFTPFISLLIFVFAFEKGKISNINNKTIDYLANISRYGFLIHLVVFRYLSSVTSVILGRDFEDLYGPYVKLTLGMLITFVLCNIWTQIDKKLIKHS